MKFVKKDETVVKHCRARTIYAAIERDGVLSSDNIMMGCARFDKNLGDMIPHSHAEEGMYIIDCAKAYARFGDSAETLGERIPLEAGMIMWAPEGEWHVFEFDDGGFLDIVFCLPSEKDFVRPE